MISAQVLHVELGSEAPVALNEMTELVMTPPETGPSVTLMAAVQDFDVDEELLIMSTPAMETESVALGCWLEA